MLSNPEKLCYDSVFELKNRDRVILASAFDLIASHVSIKNDQGVLVN